MNFRQIASLALASSALLSGSAAVNVTTGFAATTPVQPAATLPPDLVALDQKMAALHFKTERQTLQMELETKEGLLGPETPHLVFLLAGSGNVSVSPEEGSFTLSSSASTPKSARSAATSTHMSPTPPSSMEDAHG